MSKEVMQQALDWFNWFHAGNSIESPLSSTQVKNAIAAALAAPQPVQEPPDLKRLIDRLEIQWHRMGELWERCQGKGWPEKEDVEFRSLRDEKTPATRAAIAALAAPDEDKPFTPDWVNCRQGFQDGRDAEREALAAPQPTIPPGYKVVPVEPTEAMWNAMMDWGTKKSEWLAILNAAPTPPAQQEPVALRSAVFTVLEGFTLPHGARKILETAYYTTPQPQRQPLFGEMIAQHPGLSAELAEIDRAIEAAHGITKGEA